MEWECHPNGVVTKAMAWYCETGNWGEPTLDCMGALVSLKDVIIQAFHNVVIDSDLT